MKLLAEATLTLVLFADASRISLRALRREYSVPLRLLGIGLPLTIVAGTLVGVPCLLAAELAGGARARGHACVHRRGPRSGGGHRRAPALADPAGTERRERPQRRDLRAAVLHRDRPRRGRCRQDSVHSAVHLVLDADRLRGARRADRRRRRGPRRAAGGAARLDGVVLAPGLHFAAAVFSAGLAIGFGGSMFIAAFIGGLLFGTLRPRDRRRGRASARAGRRGPERDHVHRLRRRSSSAPRCTI